jgi:hypothetical protein
MSVEFFVRLRDACETEIERLKPAELQEKPQTKAVAEDNFFLNYSEYTSQKLGNFQVAEKTGNVEERFLRATNILKQNNATISSRYYGGGYQFSYWLYNSKIYRQKLKKKAS